MTLVGSQDVLHLEVPVYDWRLTVVQPGHGGADVAKGGQGLGLAEARAQALVHLREQVAPVVGHEEEHLVHPAVPQGDRRVHVADQVAMTVQVGLYVCAMYTKGGGKRYVIGALLFWCSSTDHNVDLPLADGQVLLVVDEHSLEGEATLRSPGLLAPDQEDDAEAALGQDFLAVHL